jgi:hypothetical protein
MVQQPRLLSALFLAQLVLLTTAITAQRTWIVDALGGPGSHFKDLPPAIQAASAGDTVLLRPGEYLPAPITLGLRLVAELGAVVRTDQSFPPESLHLRDLPAHQTLTIQGLRILGTTGPVLQLTDCRGVVVLDGVHANHGSSSAPAAIAISGCDAVTLRACDTAGGLNVATSTVAIHQSSIVRGGNTILIFATLPAIHATRSRLELSHTHAKGQDGFVPYNMAQPAVQGTAARITVRGLATTVLEAGLDQQTQVPALRADPQSTLLLDPSVTLIPKNRASGHFGFGSVASRRLPALAVADAARGGRLDITVHSPAHDAFALFLGAPSAPIEIPQLGDLWLDPALLVFLGAGIQGATERTIVPIDVPMTPSLLGLGLGAQAVSGVVVLELTNSPGFVLR